MRLPNSSLCLAFLLTTILPFASQAGNVLIPSDSSSSSSSGLGLTPPPVSATATPSGNASKTTTAKPATTTAPSALSQPQLPQIPSATLDENEKYRQDMLQKMRAMGVTLQTKPEDPAVARARAQRDALYEQMAPKFPPNILDETPELSLSQGLQGSAQVTFLYDSRGLAFSSNDLAQIQRTLGYSASQAQANCTIRLEGRVMSTQDAASFKIEPGTQKSVSYMGTANSVSIKPSALCAQPQSGLPQNGGLIFRTKDNRFVVTLLSQSGNCPALPHGNAVLVLQYPGRVNCLAQQ